MPCSASGPDFAPGNSSFKLLGCYHDQNGSSGPHGTRVDYNAMYDRGDGGAGPWAAPRLLAARYFGVEHGQECELCPRK
ncbi:hypothetical protein ColKHC_04756 [Colletotrichum higginsianum]|nr:hypothetical protein ColKHC_04756 [Colletotrichum higginsianum]